MSATSGGVQHIEASVLTRTLPPSLAREAAVGLSGLKTVWRYDVGAFVCALATLGLALVLGHLHRVGNFGVESDFYGTYAVQAANLAVGKPYTYPFHPPGYSWLLAVLSPLTGGDFFVVGKLISALSAALFIWIAYLLLKALFGPAKALASTLLTALSTIPYTYLASTDVLGALLMTLSLWTVLRRPRLRFVDCVLSGAWAGAAYLVRTNGLAIIVGISAALLTVNLSRASFRHRLLQFVGFLGGALVVAAPWFLINWRTNGHPFASKSYLQVAAHFFGTLPDSGGISLHQAGVEYHSAWDVVSREPYELAWKYLQGILRNHAMLLSTQGLTFPAYLFAGAGLLLLLVRLTRRWLVFLGVCAVGYLMLGLVGFQLRFYLFLFPALFLCAVSVLFFRPVRRMLGAVPRLQLSASWLVVGAIAASLSLNAYRNCREALRSEPRYLLAMADFLRHRSSPDDVVIAAKPHLAYLSGLTRAFPLAKTPEEFLVAARALGARYVVYSDIEASRWSPLKSLHDPSALPEAFKPIYRHEPSHTVIYEIEGNAR